ncbi:probable tRNA pseudouridine synthase 1 [Gracilinanus agilis]|uniref:probable tRNA pseudouridine synthase 1 n=1 Tax=Gracilinanus agilis TaxID=191870 RepID=UPI001CFD9479|nr:probable tRNA pseudouridine synthase 1 [Gracilinanus agilis]
MMAACEAVAASATLATATERAEEAAKAATTGTAASAAASAKAAVPSAGGTTVKEAAAAVTETAAAVTTTTAAMGGAGAARSAAAAKLLSLSGVFAVYKPKGPTSAELLNQLKEKLLAGSAAGARARRGEAAAAKYIATGELGKATDTLDSTGKITEEKPYDQIKQEDIEGILQKFTGNIMQVPPLYSALKKDGQRLSTLMKKGEVVEAKPARPVTVYSLSLQKFQPPLFTLDVECGGGFYIRSLVSDIGKELSSCATVQELTRTKQGPFTLEEHALREDKWTIDGIAQSLEHCMPLLSVEPSVKKLKTEDSKVQAVSSEDKTSQVKEKDGVIGTS